MIYNPYDLVPMTINGQEMHGRPFEFDSEVANSANMTNSFGHPVKPTKLSACCPDCGDGMEIEVILGEPPFAPVEVNCQKCRPELPEVVDPFMNPIDSKRVADYELDPLLHNPDEQIQEDDSTVADRLGQNDEEQDDFSGHSTQAALVKNEEELEVVSDEETAQTSNETSEGQEESKEKTEEVVKESTPEEPPEEPAPEPKATKKTAEKPATTKKAKKPEPEPESSNSNVEPAEGMSEEQDIDDDEGLEDLLSQLEEDD